MKDPRGCCERRFFSCFFVLWKSDAVADVRAGVRVRETVIGGFLRVAGAQMIFTSSDLSFAADKGHSL